MGENGSCSFGIKDMGEKVRLERLKLNETQKDLAQRAGVSRRTVMDIENGSSATVSFGAVIAVLNAANWDLDLMPKSSHKSRIEEEQYWQLFKNHEIR